MVMIFGREVTIVESKVKFVNGLCGGFGCHCRGHFPFFVVSRITCAFVDGS